jgi:glycosyltransferase involved in cell wall biosynthesis
MNKGTQSAIRVLHLFSNSKWTGPAEPVVNLCRALRDRGVHVDFACAPVAGSGYNKVQATARSHGLEPLDFLHLSKHRKPLRNWMDVWNLRRHLKATTYDLIHCHLDNDTWIALRACAGTALPVVRSSYEGLGFPNDRWHRFILRKCAALMEPSQAALRADVSAFPVMPERLYVLDTAVDTERFNSGRSLPDLRHTLGIPENAFVFGIVARIQAHRHYEDLFEAFAAIADIFHGARLMIVGRGTRQEQLAIRPIRALGLADRVHFTGYLDGDDYAGALAAMDAGMFLTPGTDGTCRAVREMMSMGKPMITSSRGMLPEMVTAGADGIVTDGSAGQLRDAMRLFYENADLRRRYGIAARETARTRFSMDRYAGAVLEVYEKTLVHPKQY